MFEGYLELGGGEVLNSARAKGYAATAPCPVTWLQCPPCDGVRDVLDDDAYTYANIMQAPWYDVEDEVTHRFLGAHAITVEGLPDSTRTADVAEAILDGGVVGRVRRATRRVRYRALLTAQGEDALEAGFDWLSSALSPGKCGIHADACGAADMHFYTACPPERTDITMPEPFWNDPLTNLAINPSFEGPTMPAGTFKSNAWAARGTTSMQIPGPAAVQVATLTAATFLITPRDSGQFIRFGGVDHPTVAGVPLRVYGTGPVLLSQGFWDEMAIVAGEYGGAYFDGSLPDSTPEDLTVVGKQIARYGWSGTADASTSTYETGTVVAVPDPVAYQAAIDRMARHLHTVTCVSGPIVEQKLHRGEAWGYIVEFVLVAAVPWMFGTTKPVTLNPSLPVVVQDVPFNLVPYPSAELDAGTVVAATNFVTNPSVEAAITGWVTMADGTKILPAQVAIAQSAELASAGTQSAKSVFTANTTNTAGSFGAQQEIALPGITATTRYSVNLWSVASVQSGTAVLGTIEYHAVWMNAASAVLRDDLIGTNPGSGGAKSMKSILPPAGTTKVLIRAFVNVTSWSTGAIIRLYADAAAVTVP